MEFEVNGRKTQVPTPNPKVVAVLVGIVIFLGAIVSSIAWISVKGSERVIWRTYKGVSDQVGEDGLHLYFRWTTTPFIYSTSTDKFVIDDKTHNANNTYMEEEEKEFDQPDVQPITIPVKMENLSEEDIAEGKTTGPTQVVLRCTMQYNLAKDGAKLIALHKDKTKSYRTTFIKPIITQIIIDATTVRDARTIYQGQGRVDLQNEIQEQLKAEPRFDEFGIIVERFVLRDIELKDKKFLQDITAEAQAEQRRKTAIKQMGAAEAEAKTAEAEARAEQNRRLVEAETKKGEEIAQAEAKQEQVILAAKAQAEQVVFAAEAQAKQVVFAAKAQAEQVELAAKAAATQVTLAAEAQKTKDEFEGEGLKLRKVAEAEGVLALGRAEAEAKRMLLMAFEGEGGTRYAQVEIAKAMGEGIEKIYYVPSTMSINTIAKDFNNAITVGLPDNTNADN